MTTPSRESVAGLYRHVGRMADLYGLVPLGECTGARPWHTRGVYFFFDPEEPSEFAPSIGRIVRVGTHGLNSGSSSTLWGRLRHHRGHSDGSGNHRGSVFRKHVGSALLARDGTKHATWGIRSSASREVRASETEIEKRVSEYLGRLLVTYVPVPDEPGPGSMRGYVEINSIGTLTVERNRWSRPTAGWLGHYSPAGCSHPG
jgi:hypothetical protein